MVFSRFRVRVALCTVAMLLTALLTASIIVHTHWYATMALCVAALLAECFLLLHLALETSREVARFLDAIAADDFLQSFAKLSNDSAHAELGAAMTRVLARLRTSRSEREEQAEYLRALVDHVPVALICVDDAGHVQLLNIAARRLFTSDLVEVLQMGRYGQAFALGIESLEPGQSAILKMVRAGGNLQLKASATALASRGVRSRLISLQNIESEMSAQELAAWQTVIRAMAHEVMNSLTPISSLAATTQVLVGEALQQLPADAAPAAALQEAREALETVAKRSAGLLHFVQNHRRLTKRLVAQIEVARIQRVFARLQRLLGVELAARDIHLTLQVEPESLEIAADPDLLDQALINLVRNSIEALRDRPAGRIVLSAHRDAEGRVAIDVVDNGPGIAEDLGDKIFVPFFTTKRQGSGIGLTIVRHIATAHSASVDVSQTPGGGATVSLRF